MGINFERSTSIDPNDVFQDFDKFSAFDNDAIDVVSMKDIIPMFEAEKEQLEGLILFLKDNPDMFVSIHRFMQNIHSISLSSTVRMKIILGAEIHWLQDASNKGYKNVKVRIPKSNVFVELEEYYKKKNSDPHLIQTIQNSIEKLVELNNSFNKI